MSNPAIRTLPVGLLETNCYLVYDGETSTLYIIDPGGDPERILDAVKTQDFRKAVILLTHAHVDHISAIPELVEKLGIAEVYLHPGDVGLYKSRENALLPFIPPAENLPLTCWPPNLPDIEVIDCPGHTGGGVAYRFKKLNALFSGDTLFRNSVGRTDLPGGCHGVLMETLEKLKKLPPDLRVYPGHGPSTTIAQECAGNPYFP